MNEVVDPVSDEDVRVGAGTKGMHNDQVPLVSAQLTLLPAHLVHPAIPRPHQDLPLTPPIFCCSCRYHRACLPERRGSL